VGCVGFGRFLHLVRRQRVMPVGVVGVFGRRRVIALLVVLGRLLVMAGRFPMMLGCLAMVFGGRMLRLGHWFLLVGEIYGRRDQLW
jgi:hypothetical protein